MATQDKKELPACPVETTLMADREQYVSRPSAHVGWTGPF